MSDVTQDVIFLSAMKWAMKDDQTGELRSGTTIQVGSKTDGTEYNPTKGLVIGKHTAGVDFFDLCSDDMAGKSVRMQCTLKASGKNIKLVPYHIELIKPK